MSCLDQASIYAPFLADFLATAQKKMKIALGNLSPVPAVS